MDEEVFEKITGALSDEMKKTFKFGFEKGLSIGFRLSFNEVKKEIARAISEMKINEETMEKYLKEILETVKIIEVDEVTTTKQ